MPAGSVHKQCWQSVPLAAHCADCVFNSLHCISVCKVISVVYFFTAFCDYTIHPTESVWRSAFQGTWQYSFQSPTPTNPECHSVIDRQMTDSIMPTAVWSAKSDRIKTDAVQTSSLSSMRPSRGRDIDHWLRQSSNIMILRTVDSIWHQQHIP